MTKDSGCTKFERLLAERGVLVADGAMGTTLFSLGLEGGGCPELLNVEHPEIVEQVHRRFIEAGADIILTNTFGGNRRRLKLHKLESRVDELNKAAVEIAQKAAAGRDVIVAASIGPTGDLFEPLGPLSHGEGVDVFAEQIAAVVDADADVVWIETISSFEELNAAAEAASMFDVPVSVTMSFDTNGRTMMGISPTQLADWWATTPFRPVSVGANCGIGPGDGVATVYDLTGAHSEIVPVTKANCGLPLYETDRLVYPVGPGHMAEYVELAVRSGARIVGSCCGSTPAHTAAIRAALDAGVAGERPARAEIEERLGAHSSAAVGARRTGGRRRG
ncbi:MAG: betaine--homocysteine S-methyltransferase [Acidimicrobiia bacterium]|nr:betaine--homocysteine S-methyltransferase [Acidimicrobiia bacterium]